MKIKKVVVTGGAGFIGSHIAEFCLREGLETIVIDNLSVGKREYVPEEAIFYQVDILDLEVLKDLFAGVDVVFHNAAKVSIRDSVKNFVEDAKTNVIGTLNVIKASLVNGVKKVIYASSMAVYGDVNKLPISENAKLAPLSPYGISKLTSELYGFNIAKYSNLNFIALRYFNTYGTRQTFTPYVGVLTIFIQQMLKGEIPTIFGTGNQIRDFVWVKDIARANILAMYRELPNVAINVGSGKGTSVNQIFQLLKRKLKMDIQPNYGPPQPGEPKDSIADITLAKKLLNYEPKGDLEDKIDEIIQWNKQILKIKN